MLGWTWYTSNQHAMAVALPHRRVHTRHLERFVPDLAPLSCRLQALTSGLPSDRAATLQGALQHADTLRPQKPHLMDMHLVIA